MACPHVLRWGQVRRQLIVDMNILWIMQPLTVATLLLKCMTFIPAGTTLTQSWLMGERLLGSCWCAILIAHQLLWQNMEAPVSIFQEPPLAGKSRERLFHIHSIHRCQLCVKYLHSSTLLWQMNGCNPQQQPGIIHWCYHFRCWKFNHI